MNSKWTGKDFGITAGISLVYFMITMVVMMSGALTPILWIFMPALIGFFTGIPYLYIVAKEAKPGVVFLMNLIVGVIYFIAGELSNLVIVTLIITTVLAEGVRKVGETLYFGHCLVDTCRFGEASPGIHVAFVALLVFRVVLVRHLLAEQHTSESFDIHRTGRVNSCFLSFARCPCSAVCASSQ